MVKYLTENSESVELTNFNQKILASMSDTTVDPLQTILDLQKNEIGSLL